MFLISIIMLESEYIFDYLNFPEERVVYLSAGLAG